MRVRLLKDHSPECRLKSASNPWAYLSGVVHLDSIGRKLRAGARGEIWHKAICNDTDCFAVALVAERDLLREIEVALRKGKR